MVRLSRSEIKKLDCIAHGGFGSIYRGGDDVYKIYHERDLIDNPSLIYRPIKFRRLMDIDKKIKYTDLIKDVIFLDGRFSGVVLPFYDGKTLMNLRKINFKQRLSMSYDLVRNCKELIGYFIYPLDFKLDNIMFVDGEVKFIDLDDCLTRVCYRPHYFSKRMCINGLDETIKEFLMEYNNIIPLKLKEIVDRPIIDGNYSFDDLDAYLDNKSKIFNYIFISDYSDLSKISLIRNSKCRVIYISNHLSYEDDVYDKVSRLRNKGLSIYDIIPSSRIDDYLENSLYDKVYEIDKGNVIVKDK